VDEFADLLLGGGDNSGMAVAGAGHADPGGEVEETPICFVEQVDALAAGSEKRGGLLQ
jgi:hypothetical protein